MEKIKSFFAQKTIKNILYYCLICINEKIENIQDYSFEIFKIENNSMYLNFKIKTIFKTYVFKLMINDHKQILMQNINELYCMYICNAIYDIDN
jgi:hypothetical protein